MDTGDINTSHSDKINIPVIEERLILSLIHISAVFNMLSGYSEPRTWNKLVVAPIWMRDRFLHQIEMEREYALKGRKARIVAKMNSLCDRDIIAALYAACLLYTSGISWKTLI